jgi:hypothetical protein
VAPRISKYGCYIAHVQYSFICFVFHRLHCVTSHTTHNILISPFFLISAITLQVELVCRVCLVLLQTHHNQLTTTPAARSLLTELKDILYSRVKVGFDLFAAIYRQLCSNLMIIIPLSPGMQGYYRLQPCRNGSYKSMVPLLPACKFLLLVISSSADISFAPIF